MHPILRTRVSTITGISMALAMLGGAAAQDKTLDAHMRDHFAWATQVQTAVINGDLESARQGASWLVNHGVHQAFPENALDDMRAAAQDVVDAKNILDAGMAVGRIGAACGHCHDLMVARSDLDSVVELPVGEALKDRMGRHLWAADRMWEGLIGPSDESWSEGAKALLESPLTGAEVTGEPDRTIADISQQIHDLAERAIRTDERNARALIYGGFVSRCAACHKSFRTF